jgi:hypothetical protein
MNYNAFEDHDIEDDELEGHDLEEEDDEDDDEDLITCPRCGATWVESQIPNCECELLGLCAKGEAVSDQDRDAIIAVQNEISPTWNNGHGAIAIAVLRRLWWKAPYDPVTDAEIEAGAIAMRQQFEEAKTTSTDGQVPYRTIVRAILQATRKVKP